MMMIEIGERRRQRLGVGAGQAGAAEHQRDVVVKDIGRDAAPQQLHRRPLAVGGIDAGTAELEDLAAIGDERRYVVFGSRIEPAEPRRGLRAGSGGRCRRRVRGRAAAAVVEHQQMIAALVEPVEVAAPPGGFDMPRARRALS